MHAVRGQERQWLSGMQSEYRKDFRAVFMSVSGSLVSFMRVGTVVDQQDMLQVNSQILG
jgi:hypothetical protein